MADTPAPTTNSPVDQSPQVRAPGASWGSIPVMTSGMTFGEYGSSGLRQFSGWVRDEFLPNLVGRNGMRTYREMADNSATIGAMLWAIRSTMRKVEWRVMPPSDTPENVEKQEFVEGLMDDMSHTWDEHIDETLTMMQYGFAPHEIVYKRRNGTKPGRDPKRPGNDLPRSKFDDGLVGWRRLPIRAQETVLKWFFDENGTVKGMTQQPWTGPIVDLPIEKMLLFRPSAHKGNPEGRSILRNAWRSYHFTKRIEEQEAILFERLNGLPVVRVPNALIEQAKNGDSAAVAQLNSFKMIATNLRINEQMGVVLSSAVYEGASGQPGTVYQYDIQLVTPEVRRTGGGPNEVLDRYNLQMLQSVLADFISLGHSTKGTQSLSVNKTDMFFQAIEGFLNTNSSVYNRHALPRLWTLNGWDEETLPEISPDLAQRVDLDVLGNFVLRLSQAGMPMFPNEEMQSYLMDAAGLPDLVDPLAMEAAGLTDELIGQQTAIATGEIADPKAEQAMAQQQRFAPPDAANANNPKDPKASGGNFGKMLRASLARRMIKMAGPRYGVTTGNNRRRSTVLKASDDRDVWFIRHGETEANAGDTPRIRGTEDVPLSEKGVAQATALGAEITNVGGVDMVVHTVLSRSKDTASEVAIASHAVLAPAPALQPWNLGFLTGMPVADAVPLIIQHVREIPDTKVMGGESFNEFKRRALTGLEEVLNLTTGQRLAIVGHHWIERLVKAWQAAGSGPGLDIDPDVMLEEGNGTGTAELLTIDANALRQALRSDPMVKRRKPSGSSKLFLEARA